MAPLDAYLSPQLQSAAIASLFIALGWWVNGAQKRKRDDALRASRVRDVQRALFAEIRAYLAVIDADELMHYGDMLYERICNEEGFFPIIPHERYDRIYAAIVSEIHILPRNTVDPIVLYYNQRATIDAMIEDLRALDLTKIDRERAANMYLDYIRLKIGALDLGQTAMDAILSNMDGTGQAAKSSETVNNPASGRSER